LGTGGFKGLERLLFFRGLSGNLETTLAAGFAFATGLVLAYRLSYLLYGLSLAFGTGLAFLGAGFAFALGAGFAFLGAGFLAAFFATGLALAAGLFFFFGVAFLP